MANFGGSQQCVRNKLFDYIYCCLTEYNICDTKVGAALVLLFCGNRRTHPGFLCTLCVSFCDPLQQFFLCLLGHQTIRLCHVQFFHLHVTKTQKFGEMFDLLIFF